MFFCSFFVGCVSFNPSHGIISFGQTAKETYETLDGVMTTESFVVIPIGSSISSHDDMGLKIGRVLLDGNIIQYLFQAELHTTTWTFTNNISVKIDDKIYRLEDDSPNRQVHNENYVIEVLRFKITPEMLEEIKMATTFSAELYKRVVTLNEKQLQKLKEFLQ
jgi:rhamnose utilization protein RhaD (predicted bifunctional aldolase and dehydrogenase)